MRFRVPDRVTRAQSEENKAKLVKNRIGGDDGTRTRGLCRDRAAF